jgi:hypothetical protein
MPEEAGALVGGPWRRPSNALRSKDVSLAAAAPVPTPENRDGEAVLGALGAGTA